GAHEKGAESPQGPVEERRRSRAHHGAQGPSRARQDRSAGCRLLDERLQLARPLAVCGARRRRRRRASISWKAELARNRSKTLDAPSWLWLSVVELMASHEAAYLNHCCRYAWDEA